MAAAPMQADFIQLIVQEHDMVKQVYTQYQAAGDMNSKLSLAKTIWSEVLKHAGKEELLVYPLMKAKLEDGYQQVEHALQEHKEVEAEIHAMETMDPSSLGDLDARMSKFMSDLVHHIADEEANMLPRLSAKCSEQERIEQGARYQTLVVSDTTLAVNRPQDFTALKMAAPQLGKEEQMQFKGEAR